MSLKWKDNSDVEQIKTAIKGKPPRAFVEKIEKWCPYNNAETSGFKRNLIKKLNKIEVQKILQILEEKKEEIFEGTEGFMVKDLIKWQGAEYLTDGSLQRKVLGILVCNGVIKKSKEEYNNKHGDTLFYCNYYLVSPDKRKICPYMDNKQKCNFPWKQAEETRYFTEKKLSE